VRLTSKFAKSANITKKIIFFKLFRCGYKKNGKKFFFSNYFSMGIKNAEFDAEFESVEKVTKKFTQRKL